MQKCRGVGLDGQRRLYVPAEHLRVDVHVDDRGRRREPVAAGPDFRETAADGEHRVALIGHCAERRRHRGAEAVPQPERMQFREYALALDRGGDRGAQLLGQLDERVPGFARAVAHVEQHLRCAVDDPRGLFQIAGLRRGIGAVAVVLPGRRIRHVVREQVELRWNLDRDRPGRARAREIEGPANGRVDVRRGARAGARPSSPGAGSRPDRCRATGRRGPCRGGCPRR